VFEMAKNDIINSKLSMNLFSVFVIAVITLT
jgi:hypothetical protein